MSLLETSHGGNRLLLRVGHVHSSGWLPENKLKGMSGDSLSHHVMLEIFSFSFLNLIFFKILPPPQCVYLIASKFCVFMGCLSVQTSVSLYLSVSYDFSWALFLMFACFILF